MFCLVADYVADTKNCTVIPAGDLNAGLCAGSMYYQAVADVDCNMSTVVYDIAGTHIAGAYSSTAVTLLVRSTGQADTVGAEDCLYEAGAVSASGQAGTAPYVCQVTCEGLCIGYNRITQGRRTFGTASTVIGAVVIGVIRRAVAAVVGRIGTVGRRIIRRAVAAVIGRIRVIVGIIRRAVTAVIGRTITSAVARRIGIIIRIIRCIVIAAVVRTIGAVLGIVRRTGASGVRRRTAGRTGAGACGTDRCPGRAEISAGS